MEKLPEYLKLNDDGSADVTLSRPADIGGVKVTYLRLREPTVRDQEIAFTTNASDAAKEIGLFANLCGISPDDVRKLPLRDYGRLQKAFGVFTD